MASYYNVYCVRWLVTITLILALTATSSSLLNLK